MKHYVLQRMTWVGAGDYKPAPDSPPVFMSAVSPKAALARLAPDSRIVRPHGYSHVRVYDVGPFDTIVADQMRYRDYNVYTKPVVTSIEAHP